MSVEEKDIEIQETKVIVHKLKEPFTYEGNTYEEITMNMEKLTGKDAAAIEEEMDAMDHRAVNPAWDRMFLRMAAARASGVPEDAFTAMPIKEYLDLTNAIRAYLLVGGTETEIQPDMKKMTGADADEVEQELREKRHFVSNPATDGPYLRAMAARAAGVKEEDLLKLKIKEYLSVTGAVRSFLLG